jgi:hypothetical protein
MVTMADHCVRLRSLPDLFTHIPFREMTKRRLAETSIYGQVRDRVREVAMNPSLGVETAREILDRERRRREEGLKSKA